MAGPVVYVDSSAIREGKLEELEAAMRELAAFVEANEPRLIAYNVYFSEDGRRMSVVHVHPDAASLAFHLNVAGPLFAGVAGLLELLEIDVFGEVDADVIEQLRAKARLLGNATVARHEFRAGFTRA